MAEYATWMTPPEIERAGARLLAHLDPDGVLTDLEDRRRRRKLWINRQRADGTSKLTATLTPELRARLATFLDVWARPGMNNPDDPDSPTGAIQDADPERLEAAAERDCVPRHRYSTTPSMHCCKRCSTTGCSARLIAGCPSS